MLIHIMFTRKMLIIKEIGWEDYLMEKELQYILMDHIIMVTLIKVKLKIKKDF